MSGWKGDARGLAWVLGGDVSSRVVGQVAVVITARLLGPSQYGALAAGLAAFGLLTVLAEFGVGDAAVQHLTRRVDGERVFWREVVPTRLVATLPLLPVGIALAAWGPSDSVRASGLLAAAIPMTSLLTGRVLAARISERFRAAAGWASLLGLCQSLGALGAAILFARTAFSAASGVAFAVTVFGLLSIGRRRRSLPSRAAATSWLRRGAPFGVTAAAVAVYSRIDRIVVAAILGTSAAGQYAAAYNVVLIAGVVGMSLHVAILPRLLDENRQGSNTNWRVRAAAIVVLTAPAAVLLSAFSRTVMTGLYGSSFAASSPVLQILSPLVVLYVLNTFLASCLVAAGQQRALARISVLNAGIALATYPLLTSEFGTRGAALASVGAELLGTLLLVSALRRYHTGADVPPANRPT